MAVNLLFIFLVLVSGCASVNAIEKNYQNMINVQDGVGAQEAKIIAQKTLLTVYEQQSYRITAPDIKTTPEALKYPDFWFVVFGRNWLSPISNDPMAKTYRELKQTAYLVVIHKKTGAVKFSGEWYLERTKGFEWIFEGKKYNQDKLPIAEAGTPIK